MIDLNKEFYEFDQINESSFFSIQNSFADLRDQIEVNLNEPEGNLFDSIPMNALGKKKKINSKISFIGESKNNKKKSAKNA